VLRHRACHPKASKPCWRAAHVWPVTPHALICRTPIFITGPLLEGWAAEGAITLFTAFSREQVLLGCLVPGCGWPLAVVGLAWCGGQLLI